MIRHIVFFTAKQQENVDAVYNGLKILETIPCKGTVCIHKNMKIDQIDNTVDIVVEGIFADEHAMAEYKSHPTYQESIIVCAHYAIFVWPRILLFRIN